MSTKNWFMAVVLVVWLGLSLFLIVAFGPRLIVTLLGGSQAPGIGSFAFGVSWSFLKAAVVIVLVAFLAVIALLWAKLARR